MTKKQTDGVRALTPAEQRAARAERVKVSEAEPYGWVARSESGKEFYILYADPHVKRLVCTCADFIYRGKDDPHYECKHVAAVLKYVGRWYITHEYDPMDQVFKEKRLAS